MGKEIIGLTGFKGSGKDTVGNCLRRYGFQKDSYAATLKDICALLFGWDRPLLEGDTEFSRSWRESVDHWWENRLNIQGFSPRLAMQLVGTNALRVGLAQDIWVASLERRLHQTEGNTVIVDCRFPNEMDVVKLNGGITIWVKKEMPIWYDQALIVAQSVYDEHLGKAEKGTYLEQHKLLISTLREQGIHESEWMWLAYPVDHIIENHGTIEDLQDQVDQLML